MDETIIITENPEIVQPENPVTTDETQAEIIDAPTPTQQLAHDLLEELQSISETETETQEETTPEEEQQIEQVDYSQQLSELSSKIDTIGSNFDSLYQSVNTLQATVENTPNEIRNAFDDIIQFQAITLSLTVGFFVVILFFKGLKK